MNDQFRCSGCDKLFPAASMTMVRFGALHADVEGADRDTEVGVCPACAEKVKKTIANEAVTRLMNEVGKLLRDGVEPGAVLAALLVCTAGGAGVHKVELAELQEMTAMAYRKYAAAMAEWAMRVVKPPKGVQ